MTALNWSLKKLLQEEPDSLNRSKIKILFIVLLFSMLKAVIVITFTWQTQQSHQMDRALVLLLIYVVFLKILLADKRMLVPLTHALVGIGISTIWSSIFLFSNSINVITMQFVFMLVVSSFYLLPLRFAFLYSILGTFPTLIYTLFPKVLPSGAVLDEPLSSPAFELIVVLNFITIIVSHYLFRQAFMDNVAEKERLNVQLIEAARKAHEAAESKTHFLSTMSHELRTPLNSVIAISELLLQENADPRQRENLQILKNSANGLHSLINNILDFNKLGSEKLSLEKIPVMVPSFLRDLVSGLKFQARQKHIHFALEMDEQLERLQVITDPTRLSQVLNNLCGNALKFTRIGSVTLRVDLVSLQADQALLRFAVKDTGIGIKESELQFIFEPFMQANASTNRHFGGTGLGLPIVKQLLALFGSSIEVKSREGEGSEFSFELALRRAPEEGLSEDTDVLLPADLSSLRLLVAEDNLMNQRVLTKVLSKWNLKPVFALNGGEALDKLMNEEFDLIFMDIHMPEMDGFQAAARIRNMPDPVKSAIPIIALTASVSDDLWERIEAAGMNGYLSKPFRIGELYNKLKVHGERQALSSPLITPLKEI